MLPDPVGGFEHSSELRHIVIEFAPFQPIVLQLESTLLKDQFETPWKTYQEALPKLGGMFKPYNRVWQH
jgi:hypothetical protein